MEAYERAYSEEVCAFIFAEAERLRGESAALRRGIREAGLRFAEDNPYASLYQSPDSEVSEAGRHIAEMERSIGRAAENEAEAAFLEKLRLDPYFGRVDFAGAGDPPTPYYIGRRTLLRRGDGAILTYDWRAPVSALFYTGEVGAAAYDAPGGTVSGEISRIRQYRFRDGRLDACWDADLRIDDAVLRDVLSGASAEKMRAIINTIQRDQNCAIRADAAKSLAVFGPAGCGKTSVGMHRLAWLLYEARAARIKPDLLMFTANEAFRVYVSGVLPELGEEEIGFCSFAELFRRHLKGFTVEGVTAQTEALLCGDPARELFVRAVYDPGFAAYMESRLAALPARFTTLSLFGRTVLSAQTLREKYAGLTAPAAGDRLDVLKRWARDEIRAYFRRHRKALYDAVFRGTAADVSTDAALDAFREKFLQKAEKMIDGAVLTDAPTLYRRFFADRYGENDACAALKRRLSDRKLYFEDGVLLLWLRAALGLCRGKTAPTHVLIDEAQDYAPLQHRTLRLLYPKTTFTVLADVNQGVVPAANSLDAEEIAAAYGARVFSISKSYRSTRQIGEFAKRFLSAADYELFDREGPAPAFYETEDDPAETAAEIIRGLPEKYRAVCVILRTAREAGRFAAALRRSVPDCAAVTDEKSVPAARVLCMPAALTKGLEFDVVIIPDFDAVKENSRMAYLMTTRALHELHLIR